MKIRIKMNSFPITIRVENKLNFAEMNIDRITSIFREEIFTTIIRRKDENEYIDLDTFSRQYCGNKSNTMNIILNKIRDELHNLGWKTELSFGDSGLFIYSTDEKPTSCW